MLEPHMLETFFNGIDIASNAAVLDVGCQSAVALKWIKEKYHISGALIGIDKQAKHFEDAASLQGLGISLVQMNASVPLHFQDEAFDLIFHCNTLECITDIPAHIIDLHRILKRDGIIVCVHRDWESIVFNGSNKALINKAVFGYANFLQEGWMDACDGWIGRRVWGYFHQTGLFDGEISVYNRMETAFVESTVGWRFMHDMHAFLEPKGFLTEAEYRELIADMAETHARGEYLCMSPYYIYKGRKRLCKGLI